MKNISTLYLVFFLITHYYNVQGQNSADQINYSQNFKLSVAAVSSSVPSGREYTSFQSYFLYPPSCFYQPDSATYLEVCPPLDSTGTIPPGFMGYNLYRDGDFINTYPPETTEITFFEPNPGYYIYDISAVYDLSPYGYPGQTGESSTLTSLFILNFGYYLDFSENWDSGNLDENNWTPSDANWAITYVNGNPAPAAEFSWDPVQTNYSVGLESYPFRGDILTEGNIWLDYDIKLASVNPTGAENMDIQVWNWEGQAWTTVKSYSNADGSFDWISDHVDITSQAMGKVFRIRFLANGTSSMDILGWFVDNINVYRACAAPTNLVVQLDISLGALILNWTSPIPDEIHEWINWDDGVNYQAIGTDAAAEFDCAARWGPSQLTDYDGSSVTQVAFYPAEAAATYHIRVWKGAGAADMVVDQLVTNPEINAWNYITLDTPVPVDISQELWIGYYVNTSTGYPAGCDAGPAIDGYGNMMNFGGWQTLLQISPDLDYNWNIEAYVLASDGKSQKLQRITVPDNNSFDNTGLSTKPGYRDSQAKINRKNNRDRTFLGFNIYRSVNNSNFEFYDFSYENAYTDGPNLPIAFYCYEVSSVFRGQTDTCESNLSNLACGPFEEVREITDKHKTLIYPNPADEKVFIKSPLKIKTLRMKNFQGKEVFRSEPDNSSVILDISQWPRGIYFLEINTTESISFEKLIIL